MSTMHCVRPTIRLADLYAPIEAELAEAERIFEAELGSQVPYVRDLVEHCSRFRGKRLRPALVLLAGQACGGITPAHPVLAAVVEMIHTATLVHDDILDDATVRRHAPTINAAWGAESAVLLGDYLFTHAFHLAASLETTLACRWIGRATNLVCEGELHQISRKGDLDLDEDSYYAIVRGKTAELTAVSCRLGAHYAGADESTVRNLETYGLSLGVAFQIADDVLDIWGEEGLTGKSLGSDMAKGKMTLPLIRLLQTADPATRACVVNLLEHPSTNARARLRPFLDDSDARDYSWDRAREAVDQAVEALRGLPPTPAQTVLRRMADAVIRRST